MAPREVVSQQILYVYLYLTCICQVYSLETRFSAQICKMHLLSGSSTLYVMTSQNASSTSAMLFPYVYSYLIQIERRSSNDIICYLP